MVIAWVSFLVIFNGNSRNSIAALPAELPGMAARNHPSPADKFPFSRIVTETRETLQSGQQ
jgi:hypothetical protein